MIKHTQQIIRYAQMEDAERLLSIYAPYVMKTAISFEYEVPSIKEFKNRMELILKKYPYLVAVVDGIIAGYAYANTFKQREAYDWVVETTIYVDQNFRGTGIGRALYQRLETELQKQNIQNMEACIAYTEAEEEHLTNASQHFHEAMGFNLVGSFHKCGYKFDTWYDMIWMEKQIGNHPVPASEVQHRRIRKADIDDIGEASVVEMACFSEADAATRDQVADRIRYFADCFWLMEERGKIVGFVNGMATDDEHLQDEMFAEASLHNPDGKWQMLFSVATLPEYQGQGIAGTILRQVEAESRERGRLGIVLTCKEFMLPFYERFGYVKECLSDSTHGGAVWYEMRLKF